MPAHSLNVRSCTNVRDLGGHDSPYGVTVTHRFVRCGATRGLTRNDLAFFRDYGVTRVLDLRGAGESPALTCRFRKQPWVTWENIELYDVDISSPSVITAREEDNYLVSSYLHMLASASAIRRIFSFFASAKPHECVLFHCAAGMDRTGMVAMLLLGLVDVPREQIVADYAYSFGTVEEVDAAVASGAVQQTESFLSYILGVRIEAIGAVYDALLEAHGSVEEFLRTCGIDNTTLDAVRMHLLT